MKILLIQHHGFINGSGGTEKICCFLSNNFIQNNFEVEIATNQNIEGKPMFPLDNRIKISNIFSEEIVQKEIKELYNYEGINPFLWIYYKVKKKIDKVRNKKLLGLLGNEEDIYKFNLGERSKAWNRFITESKPSLIITMSIGSLLEITYNNSYDIPILDSVNGRPDYDFTDLLWYRSNVEMQLLKKSYNHLSGIQVLFDSYKKYLPSTFNGKSFTIPNPVFQLNDSQIINHLIKKERYTIINIASLNASCKQQNIAISIFSQIAHKYLNWDLEFWGIGNDLEMLKIQVKNLGLEHRVFFRGFTNEPIQKLLNSDLFIFPSKYEGFPLALTEAMSVGLPCVAFESCSGVNELISNDSNGFLSTDEKEMQNQLENLINDRELRKKIGLSSHKSVQQYTETNVSNKWLEMIQKFL